MEREKMMSVFFHLIEIFNNSNKENKIYKIKARKYLKMAADHGFKEAQHNYAHMLYNGEGGERDLDEARTYYKLAGDQGDNDAQFCYAAMLYNGKGGAQDLGEARKYYKLSADQGDAEAQLQYALMLYKGEGGVQHLNEARKYQKFAADQGNASAQFNYAYMLYNGEGGEQDLDETSRYAKMAADQGDKDAQYYYALMLYDGEGGTKDLDEGLKYFKMAVNQGSPQAIMLLNDLSSLKNNSPSDLSDKDVIAVEQDLEADMKITLAPLEEMPEETALKQELHQLNQENEQAYAKSRIEKQSIRRAKREAALRTRHTLTVKKKDYIETCKNPLIKMPLPGHKNKAVVQHETLEFVKAIFGQGKINTYSNKDAQKAFADLGCKVENKKGENSTSLSFSTTSLSFDLEGNRNMALDYQAIEGHEEKEEKSKYHNPHAHGDNNLYNALKPHLKRFLNSINKTPETLQVK
ncbi:MAG: sel1 repeat family protein [Alphaproteobacteria bacterium]|nr:sel1 repeat family protein [Alphaproteobacteria bacterium]